MEGYVCNGAALNCDLKVTLKGSELWQAFRRLDTEMIITKTGRKMFPIIDINVEGMKPHLTYAVYLEFRLASRCRFKYSKDGGWSPAGTGEAQNTFLAYKHPEGEIKGEQWMSKPSIKFDQIRITNTPSPPRNQICLSSMHRYQPCIVIVQTDSTLDSWGQTWRIDLPDTEFVAVTAYQNSRVTKLKIDRNPFAKGFKETGKAKCKRKRNPDQPEEYINVVDLEGSSDPKRPESPKLIRYSDSPASSSGVSSLSPSTPAEQNSHPNDESLDLSQKIPCLDLSPRSSSENSSNKEPARAGNEYVPSPPKMEYNSGKACEESCCRDRFRSNFMWNSGPPLLFQPNLDYFYRNQFAYAPNPYMTGYYYPPPYNMTPFGYPVNYDRVRAFSDFSINNILAKKT
ncbi:T-box-containing protein TBX6L [Dendroctonus ponderosae]|uniref:T-box-containing protein TBX6L n=1 Tax=Dendroctonus ponderosae TaxID=77166 RepID=UPI002034F890|nr:T-box-containing protein TBX6L [Dendroctonus ponderosae]